MAAWYGGEHFILGQVQALTKAVLRLSSGDLQARTGLKEAEGELGQLAQKFDEMADALQKRQKERDEADRKLLNRAMQQTAVSAVCCIARLSNFRSASSRSFCRFWSASAISSNFC